MEGPEVRGADECPPRQRRGPNFAAGIRAPEGYPWAASFRGCPEEKDPAWRDTRSVIAKPDRRGRDGARARRTLHRMARRSGAVSLLSGVVACASIAASISLGLRLPSEARLAPFPPGRILDYEATFRSGLAPLREGFIREALGETALSLRGPAAHVPTSPLDYGRADDLDPFELPRVEDVHAFVNDDMAEARAIGSIPFTGKTDTRQATREPGEPRGCGSEGGTAWYRYSSTRDEDLIANTFGTKYAVRLAVYESGASGSPTFVGCDSDLTGNALVQFSARRNVTYLFQIAAQTTGGRLVFGLEPGGVTELVSATPGGQEGSGQSLYPSISSDGRYIAFQSHAADLTPDTPRGSCGGAEPPILSAEVSRRTDSLVPCFQVYIADRVARSLRLASVSSDGEVANDVSEFASLSGDGHAVAFVSFATNLDPPDSNDADDVFVHDFITGRTERVSVSTEGEPLDPGVTIEPSSVSAPSISEDGRYVAFSSSAANLVAGDTNRAWDVFVRDRATSRTERVSLTFADEQPRPSRPDMFGTMTSHLQSISSDGRYVVFVSSAALVPTDDNGKVDVFLRDRLMGTTEIVSISSEGEAGDDHVVEDSRPRISADGRFVVFGSLASNLVDDDRNRRGDIFVRDRVRQTTIRVNVSSSGVEANGDSWGGTISRNGRYVAYSSLATKLAPGSRSEREGRSCDVQYLAPSCPEDLYVYDLVTATTTRIPVAPAGKELEAPARNPSISADGSAIAFFSGCLDPECTPGLAQVWVHERYRRNP